MSSSILFIDDDVTLLKSFKRNLNHEFKVVTAETPEEGLHILEQGDSFSIIVSDMKMPRMNGVEVLCRAQEISPYTVRVLLTGYADQKSAIDAINIGKIFRFLTKPCELDTLMSILREGIYQHQLLVSEKELLNQTINGVVHILSQILTLVNPIAQNKSNRLAKYCNHVASKMQFKEKWLLETAAMLSQLGCLNIPSELLSRYNAGGILTEEELQMVKDHHLLAGKLLMHLPKFENVIEIIALHNKSISKSIQYQHDENLGVVNYCGEILNFANYLDRFIMAGIPPADALELMKSEPDLSDPNLAECFNTYDFGLQNMVRMYVRCLDLEVKMIIDEDVYGNNGLLLVTKGQRVTFPILSGLLNFSRNIGVREPFAVLTPLVEFCV